MDNPTLKIDGGLKRIELVNAQSEASVEVLVAIYDIFFIGRILEIADACDKLQTQMMEQSPDADAGNEAFIEFYHKAQDIDREMRNKIDGLFNDAVCDALFPNQSMFAIGNGAPTWANFLTGIVESMDIGLDGEKKKAQERIRKYSAKYRK